MAQVKPNFVDIWLFKGKNTYTGKTSGKVFGGILSFSQSDPTKPVVWLGQKSYTVMNLTNKKTTLLYDTLTHSLFRPSEMSIEGEDSIDTVSQMTQNVLISADASRQALGISDMLNTGFRYGLAILILFTIFALVFLYLFYTHMPIPPGVTTTIHATTNALTTINSGPNIVPLNGVT